jgi:long-chain acyl-CoA synthetase
MNSSVPAWLKDRVRKNPQAVAQIFKSKGVWQTRRWDQVAKIVHRVSFELQQLQVQSGDRVALISNTRPEWAILDWAILSLGAVTVPVYPTLSPEDMAYILHHSGARVLLLEDAATVARLDRAAAGLREKTLKLVIQGTPIEAGQDTQWIQNWFQVTDDHPLEFQTPEWSPDRLASLVYTSGTSGTPKGVRLTHSNFVKTAEALKVTLNVTESDLFLSHLPSSHVLGRIELMTSLATGSAVAFAPSIATLSEALRELQPTILVSVPRVLEKVYQSVHQKLSKQHPALRFLLERGVRLSKHGQPSLLNKTQLWGIDKWILSRVRNLFGGRLRFVISGGAPLSDEVADLYRASRLTILQGYGMTETTGPICVNTPESSNKNSVGRALPESAVKISKDGEVLLRGPGVTEGYWQQSDPHLFIEEDGFRWLRSGDLGFLDRQGFLVITGRMKEIIVTSNGKNIAPQKIESYFRSNPLFSQVLVLGDERPYCAALITLNTLEAKQLAKSLGVPTHQYSKMVKNPLFEKAVRREVEALNRSLAPFEAIKSFKILAEDFTQEAGELTPSLKLKRHFCLKKYADQIEDVYQGGHR